MGKSDARENGSVTATRSHAGLVGDANGTVSDTETVTSHRLIASSRRLSFFPGGRRPSRGNSPTPDQETFRAIEFKTSGAVSDDGPPDQAREPVPQPLTLPKTNRVVARVEHAHRPSVPILALRPCSFKRAGVEFSQRFLRSVRLLSQISDLTIKPRSLDVSAAHSAGYPNRICVVVEQT